MRFERASELRCGNAMRGPCATMRGVHLLHVHGFVVGGRVVCMGFMCNVISNYRFVVHACFAQHVVFCAAITSLTQLVCSLQLAQTIFPPPIP